MLQRAANQRTVRCYCKFKEYTIETGAELSENLKMWDRISTFLWYLSPLERYVSNRSIIISITIFLSVKWGIIKSPLLFHSVIFKIQKDHDYLC